MRSYRYLHYDVFTDRRFSGNQLAVFPDGRGLSVDTMQAIAKEMNFAESTFVFPAERPDTDARLRIFTPGAEMPMAGHPTIGSTFALASSGAIPPARERFVFGLGVGPVPVSLVWRDAHLAFAWMTQLNPTFDDPIQDRAATAAILGLSETALSPGLTAQIVSCGMPCLLVPLATRRDVDAARLNPDAWHRLQLRAASGTDCVFLFSTETGADQATVYSRMFADDLGVSEDSATGGAGGPLGCYLVRHGVVSAEQAKSMLSLQGAKMGRPSHIHISISVEDGAITAVRVGGEAVLVGEGTLQVE